MADQWRLGEKEKRKYELADQFGLTDQLREKGWAGISAKDSGRIGGLMHQRKKTPK